MDTSSNNSNKLEFKTDRQTLDFSSNNNLLKERTEPVTDPLAPGYIGGPVIIKDDAGNRIGNVWSAAEGTELGDAIRNVEKGNASSIYFDVKSNKFTNYPASSMSYKDGKINLNVADDVANSDWYKRIFDSDSFNTLADLYALDPSGKTEIEIEQDGNKEKKTINDMLKEYADTLAENSQKYQGNIDTRELFKKATNGALVLSDDDLAMMSVYQEVSKHNYGDDDMVPLPDFAKEYFKDYESYNTEDGSISAKDFFGEFYQLDKEAPDSLKAILKELGNGNLGDTKEALQDIGESEKDYAIDLVRLGAEREMNSIITRMVNSDLTEKNDPIIQKRRETMSIARALTEDEKAELTTEFVKCYSLYQMMVQDTPDSSSWTGFNLAVQNLGIGLGDSFITNTERALTTGGYLAWGAGATVGSAAAAIDGLFGFLGGIITNFFEGGVDKVNENFDYISNSWGRSIESVFGEGSFLDEWKDSIDSVSQALDTRTDLAGTLYPNDFYKDMAQTYATAATMQRIGSIAGYALNQILITNPIGNAVGGAVASYVGDTLSMLTTGETMANAMHNMAVVYGALGSTANSIKMATDSMRVLNAIQTASKIAGFSANILTQGVVDTFLENPSLTDAVLFGNTDKNTANFQDELRNNIVANFVGEMLPFAGKGLNKTIKGFANTKVGSILQGIARKQVNWFTIKGRKLYQGISEFMTRKSKTELVEDLGTDAPYAKVTNPEMRMQALRKEIIEIQEQIKDTKIFRGEGSWSENAAKIDELVQARIDLEETLGVARKIQLAEAKDKIVKNAGLKYDTEILSVNTAKLSRLSKKIGQTNLPGSFSTETSDYINDLFNKRLLDNKIDALSKAGKTLSKNELSAYNALSERIAKYEATLPSEYATEYKALAKEFLDNNGRYYWKLNNFLASDTGGNLIPLDQLEKMRANGVYGAVGEQYMPLYAIGDTEQLGKMLYDPNSIIEQGRVSADVKRFNRKSFSENTVYLDPNYTRDLYVNAYAKMTNAANMTDAINKVGRTTSVPTDSKGNILKTPEAVASAKKNLYDSLKEHFGSSFRQSAKQNELGEETIKSGQKSPEKYWKTAEKQAQRDINKILGLDQRGLKRYASTLSSEEIADISKVYDLPNYSAEIKSVDQLKEIYNTLSESQKKIVDKTIPGFGKSVIGGTTELKGKLNTPDDIVITDYFYQNGTKINDVLNEKFLKNYGIRDAQDFKKFLKQELEKINSERPAWRDEPENLMRNEDFYNTVLSYRETRMKELFNSKENIDFLEQIGWKRGYVPTLDGAGYSAAYRYNTPTKGAKLDAGSLNEQLALNLNDVLSLPELKSMELHEMSHAAWVRASKATRQRIGQDLVSKLGLDIPVDKKLACSRAMNELVAYSTEARYDLTNGLKEMFGSDEVVQHYLDEIANYAGVKNTIGFKERIANVVDSFLAYVKTKILGINSAKNFDDWYNGLLNGDFSKELSRNVDEFKDIFEEDIVGGLDGVSPGKEALDHWNYAVKNNNLDNLLSRQYIKDSKTILESTYYKDMVGAKRAVDLNADETLALREAKISLEEAETNLKTGELTNAELKKFNAGVKRKFNKVVRNTIADAVEGTAQSLMDNPYLEQLIKEYEKLGILSDSAKEYLIYQWLFDNKDNTRVLQAIAFDFYNASSKTSGLKISTDAASKFAKKFNKASQSIIESKLNKVIAKIQEEGVEDLVDMVSTMKRVETYFKDITDLWGAKRIVEAWDREKGQFKYYKVDNSTYTLVTNYPSFKKNNLFARTMARINSLARVGQITLRTASLVTQGFKDTFNAMILGGWDEIWLDNPNTYKKIAEYIGPDVVEAFRKEMTPSAWKEFLATADWEGLSVEEAIAKAEINNEFLNLKIEGPGTSARYYSARDLNQGLGGVEQVVEDTWVKNKAQWMKWYRKAGEALGKTNDALNILHNARETFLRKQVYRQNFAEALDAGKSLAQARNYASYFMENATTNFSRGFAWGSNIVRSIPYFGAMLNGASSMLRLLEIDPVGIMTRFTTDLVIPTIGLTVMSLQDPNDVEVYKNIPEYEKENNMHWVMNGQVFTIPLPEELSKFILPIRHMVEKMHDGNDLAWNELLVSDILNMPTIPLDGIMALDEQKLGANPSVADRLSNVAMDLFNSLSPNAARTAYIAVTGKDPYTHEDYGRMRYYQDENGEYQLMATSEYEFCNDLANLFKSWGWGISPVMAEGLLSSIFGTGSMDIVEGIRDFSSAAQRGEFNIPALLSPAFERAGNVLTGTTRTDEQQAQIAWYNIYNELKAQKNELLAPDGKLAKYSQDIDMAKTQEKQDKSTEFYYAEVRNWQNHVIDTVKQYIDSFGDYYDRSKFASTLSTMTADLSINARKDSTDYYSARNFAIQTMSDAGFDSPNDVSIFGYVTKDYLTGGYSIKYYDPLVVSMAQTLLFYQADEAVNMMTQTLEYSGLKSKYKEEIYPSYNKYMNAGNYTEANKLAANWDVEVMQALKPIIDDYTVGDLLNSSVVIDLLDNYILIPNTTEAIGKGKYYSSKTGLNKRRGFTQSYAKKIYNAMKESK